MYYYHNMGGMRSSLEEFRNDLDNSIYQAAMVSESWAKSAILNQEIVWQGWQVFRCDRNFRDGGGVLIAINGNLSPSEVTLQLPDGCSFEVVAWQVQMSQSFCLPVCFLHSSRPGWIPIWKFIESFDTSRPITWWRRCFVFSWWCQLKGG